MPVMNTSVESSGRSPELDDVRLGACYIDGRWLAITDAQDVQPLINPATGQVLARAPLATRDDVAAAVTAAVAAGRSWREQEPAARGQVLSRIADAMQARQARLVELSMLNNGKIRAEAETDVADAIATYRHYAEVARTLVTCELLPAAAHGWRLYRRMEPVGACALIVPWNFPMVTTAWKVAPALLAGCTAVLKPSEVTLLPELVLGDIASAAGVPKGVLNIVPGAGAVGAAMVADPRLRKISFTGSNGVGEHIMADAAPRLQRLSLELGGKSPIVVFDDVDLDSAVAKIIAGVFQNGGQMCSATSRLIVADVIADRLYARLKEAVAAMKVGPAADPSSTMGPLVSRSHHEKVCSYLDLARSENLQCLTGGHALPGPGFFVAPTVYVDVPPTSRLWREEIFGPVLVTARFSSEAEAVELANDSDFGLAATVLSKDTERGWRVIHAIDAGSQWLNEFQYAPPSWGWGGFKRSGVGRELGSEGLRAYQESKYVMLPAD